MSFDDTRTALAICLAIDVPVILWGPPGQGKSRVIEQLAVDRGLHLETVLASVREPSDFAGLPVVDHGTGSVVLAPPRWASRLVEYGGGVLFFDEVSTAPPSVQAALLRVALDKVVGDLALPTGTRIVAAANPAGLAADGWDLSTPLANRFCHLSWTLPASDVRQGFCFGWEPVTAPSVDRRALTGRLPEARAIIGSFVGARPELATRLPDVSDPDGVLGFPTPRSWETAALFHAAVGHTGAGIGVWARLVGGVVGPGAAAELLAFVEDLDLPDPESLLADPARLQVPEGRSDKVHAVASAVCGATTSAPTTERWTACGRVLAAIARAGYADIALVSGRPWLAARPEGAVPDRATMDAMTPILAQLGRLG